ncbi:hypothetical protein GOP47_0022528 [Adiantum capillus-veneris]|uniref:Uncharacterized protein n=1 Tax=Adiantum capillus-veneris TaxID=13818 RepID=A0A9D4Z5F3_ADICA|nr:hypothetical protein GOP47_0022528 [Adiantum capillus-veneris]
MRREYQRASEGTLAPSQEREGSLSCAYSAQRAAPSDDPLLQRYLTLDFFILPYMASPQMAYLLQASSTTHHAALATSLLLTVEPSSSSTCPPQLFTTPLLGQPFCGAFLVRPPGGFTSPSTAPPMDSTAFGSPLCSPSHHPAMAILPVVLAAPCSPLLGGPFYCI